MPSSRLAPYYFKSRSFSVLHGDRTEASFRTGEVLAGLGRRRPRQATLRQAVSTAYYAVFHPLIHDATRSLARGDRRLQRLLARVFGHEDMAHACRTFGSSGPPPQIVSQLYPQWTVPPELADVANAFVALQKSRHDADYATHVRWSRKMVSIGVARAEHAFAQWEKVRPRPKIGAVRPAPTPVTAEAVRLFLSMLVFQKKLQGR